MSAVAIAAALATVVTLGVRPTAAAWVTSASVGQGVGVASSTCTTPGVYRTTSTSRVLAGSVAGVPLSSSGALAALTANNDATTTAFPAGATARGADAATTTVSSGAVSAAVALLSPTGTQTQYTSATSTGTSSAASGAVTTGGTIDDTSITSGTAPTVGSVAVSSALTGVAGGTAAAGQLSQVRFTSGAAGATATLNECARRWGASLSSALDRRARVSSLGLSLHAGAVADLLDSAADRSAIDGAVSTVTGGSATSSAETAVGVAAGGDLVTALKSALGTTLSSSVGTATATAVVTSDFSGVAAAGRQSFSAPSAPVRLDGRTGDLTVDLSAIAGTTSPAPNTDLLSATTTGTIASGASGASSAFADAVDQAWSTSLSGTTIRVDLSVPIASIGTVTTTLSGSATEFAAGSERVDGPVLAPLSALPLGLDLGAVTASIQSIPVVQLKASTKSVADTRVVAPLQTAITSTRTALGNALTTARSLIPGQVAALPGVVAVTLNEQPDVAPFPAPVAGTGTGYQVTAMRVKVLGGRALDLAIDATSVGPDTTINQ